LPSGRLTPFFSHLPRPLTERSACVVRPAFLLSLTLSSASLSFVAAAQAIPVPASAPGLAPGYIVDPAIGPLRWGESVDVDVAVGYGLLRGDRHGRLRHLRARFGALFLREPWFPAVGMTAELSSVFSPKVGLEAESLSTATNTWLQLGLSTDLQWRYGAHIAVGWEMMGFEVGGRRLAEGGLAWTFLGKLRLPLGHLLVGLDDAVALARLRANRQP